LIVYYCDMDDRTGELKDIHQTSVLDTFIDDYSTFDDYIKILSMRLEHSQKKHRTEMDELRRHKEDLTNEVQELRTKKQELIRLIGQERSLMKRELPTLAKAKTNANLSQDTFESAEQVIRDKFNDTKLHVMTMMQFRDNHLRKLTEEKAKRADVQAKIQVLKGDIEELLSHYFMLQNAHNKLEHTVALLSELTTLCHEVNVRKKTEYEREIKDLLAMIERYRCRIRNVDRLIEGYEKEVVELRMQHEERAAEFKRIQKNPTTNRTAATIDYYVAQRKLYEERAEKTADTLDDFMNINQKYAKEIKQKQTWFNHYQDRSRMADSKFKHTLQMKNKIMNECREICKAVGMSFKEAKRKFLEKGHPQVVEFTRQLETMAEYEGDKVDYEFVDPPMGNINANEDARAQWDPYLANKTHDQLVREQQLLDQDNLDRIADDIPPDRLAEMATGMFNKVSITDTMSTKNNGLHNRFDEATAKQMSRVHRGDPRNQQAYYRGPAGPLGAGIVKSRPNETLEKMEDAVSSAFRKKYGRDPQPLVNPETLTIMGPSDDEDDDDDDDEQYQGQYRETGRDRGASAASRGSRGRSDSDEPAFMQQTRARGQSSSKSVRFRALD